MDLLAAAQWQPPHAWRRLVTVDAHTAGEPFRVVVDGIGQIPGNTIVEKRNYAERHLDGVRRALMWEPRGHADMYGCFVTEPVSPGADVGVLFLHNDGFSTMCGHGIIALTTVLTELGLTEAAALAGGLGIDTPAGPVRAWADVEQGRVRRVRFLNVPSFVFALDRNLSVPELGTVRCDLAYGGGFYAYVNADQLGLTLSPEHARSLIDAGMAIKAAANRAGPVHHPYDQELSFLYGTIFVGPAESPENHSRHVCIFANGEVDRSPTGTGVSARLALLYARGEIGVGDTITIESILGTTFSGRVEQETSFGPHTAIVPEVSGSAHLVGRMEFWIDPTDPVAPFLIR